MTIECTACHARYTIADALVPAQGARVRCRKCGTVFAVKPAEQIVTPAELPVIPPTPEPQRPEPEPEPERQPEPERPEPQEEPQLEPALSATPPSGESEFERFPSSPSHTGPDLSSEFERFPAANAGPAVVPDVEVPTPPAPEPAPAPAAPAAPAAEAEPAPTPASAAPAPQRAESGAKAPFPAGLTPEEQQKHERARRFARVLASDIAVYNREKRERGIREGNLVAMLGYEIKKSWETYKERVGAEFANSTPYFRDALNEIVAEGEKLF